LEDSRRTLSNINRVATLSLSRASVREFDDKHLMQQIKQADVMHSETPSDFERWQMVGLTSMPLKQEEEQQQSKQQSNNTSEQGDWNHNQPKGKSAEALMLYLNGSRSHPVGIVDDRRVRPYAMKEGETALYAASGTGQMLFHNDDGSYLVAVNNPPEQSKDSKDKERFTSVRHVIKAKQPREIKKGSSVKDHKHEGEKVNLEVRTTKDKLQTRDGDNGVVGIYDKTGKKWTHQILANSDDTTNPSGDLNSAPDGGGVLSQLSGMTGQAQALTSSSSGLPGIQGIGSQIAGMGSEITGAGGSTGIASSITGLGTSMSTSLMAGMPAIMSSLTSQMSSLTSMINPGGAMSNVIHSSVLDKAKGIVHSAFQGNHTTTLDNNGVSLRSSAKIISTAPQIPHNGQVLNSDNVLTTGSSTAASFPVVSDERLKGEIEDHPSVLNAIMELKLKRFNVHKVNWESGEILPDPPRPSIGLLAQDVQKIFPGLVHGNNFLAIEESKIGLLLLDAFQEFVVEVRSEISKLKESK
jgi:phage gp45-like